MFNFCSLYSGSTGNCLLVQTDESNILIDVGVSQKKITSALASFNIELDDIDAIFVTHEHSDHVLNLGSISKRYNIPIFCNKETLAAMPNQEAKIADENKNIFNNEKNFTFKDLTIRPFSIPHDAANPVGFNIFHDNKKITIGTDIGHMDTNLIANFQDSNFVLLEANYDPDILKYSKYPFQLKQRILSSKGHLSNESAGKTLCKLIIDSNLSTAMLGHLSKENNFPELAVKTVLDELSNQDIPHQKLSLDVASRDFPSKIIKI